MCAHGGRRGQARGRTRIRPAAVAGDTGYSFPSLRRYLRRRDIRAVIPSKSNQPRQRGAMVTIAAIVLLWLE